MINLDQHGLFDDDDPNEMAQEVRGEITRMLRSAGLAPEQVQKMTPQELADKLDGNEGDAEDAEAEQNRREAPYIAWTVPQKMDGWVISFATIPSICEETCMPMWAITIYSHPGDFMIGSKFIVGRPTAKDCKLALQVAMAYPLVGKSRRPMTLLLAWRMKDMLDEMDRFCMEHDIMPRHETLDVARIACEEYDTDVHGHNHPIDNLTVKRQELSRVEKLREEGNEFFVCKRYQKALTKYSEALQLDSRHAALCSNRSICYLRLGHADKAIADANEAIHLKSAWDKPYARKAEALREQGRLDDVQKLYKDCIKRFEHNAFFKDALLKLHEERASFE